MVLNSKIYVAGHRGLVGSAVIRRLEEAGYRNIITRTSEELDLRIQSDVQRFFKEERPEYIFDCAALVGGIMANKTKPAEFITDNLMIQTNLMYAAHRFDVKKFLFLGSACIYPKLCPQPIKEEYLLTGELEPTNEAYAIAKIAGVIMAQSYVKQFGKNFISLMPTNLYGQGDNYDLQNSHVLPALIRKLHEAKLNKQDSITLWGTGTAKREFLHVDDLASAAVFLMEKYDSPEIINIGSGEEVSIKELSEIIKEIVGYTGEIKWDTSKPDGTPRRILDVSKLTSMGWKATVPLKEGIQKTYELYA